MGTVFLATTLAYFLLGLKGALLVGLIAVLVPMVLLERLQARDSPVMLESHGAGETPSQAELTEMSKKLPDARPSSGALR